MNKKFITWVLLALSFGFSIAGYTQEVERESLGDRNLPDSSDREDISRSVDLLMVRF